MARLARIVAPGCPHHVTARGNRREPIFFEDGDQDIYRDLLAEQLDKAGALARRRRDASRRRAPRTSPICFDGMHWGMVVLSLGYGAPVPLFLNRRYRRKILWQHPPGQPASQQIKQPVHDRSTRPFGRATQR